MDRDEIHIIARHSEWPARDIKIALQENVYPSPRNWQVFLKWTCLGFGVAFFLTGVIFFFAFNWQYMHKFAKLGIVAGAIALAIGGSLIPRLNGAVRKSLLTVASVLTGVLFAVFGQIYQTGANAYNLFLGWMVFSFVWVAVARFPLLWLLYFILVNITWLLFLDQQSHTFFLDYGYVTTALLNFLLFVLVTIRPNLFTEFTRAPRWLLYPLAAAIVSLYTAGVFSALDDERYFQPAIVPLFVAAFFGFLLYQYGMRQKEVTYPVLTGLSAMLIGLALMIYFVRDSASVFIIGSFYILGTLAALVVYFLQLIKKWKAHEQ